MDESTRLLIKIAAILLPAAVLVWSLWMIRQHWIKKDPATKHRRTETMMLQPFMMGFFGLIITPVIPLIIFDELKRGESSLGELLLILGIGLVLVTFLICYGTRQVVIYDYDHLRYRPVFGRMRTYDFSQIHSMTPIIFDLLVHVGHRWILLDFQQDWYPLWEKYHSWRKRNGLPVKKRTYKTALGRAYGETPGGIGIFVIQLFFLVAGPAAAFFFAVMAWKDREIGVAIIAALFALFFTVFLILVLLATANPEKYPRLRTFSLIPTGPQNQQQKKRKKPKQKEDA